MEIIHIATGHAFDILGSIAIIGSLLFTALELRHVQSAQRVKNLLEITKQHREIWSELFDRPALSRILEANPNLETRPITNSEALFVTFLILHLHASFQARKQKMYASADALHKDIKWFFSLPIPKSVWENSKDFQDAEFARYVELNR